MRVFILAFILALVGALDLSAQVTEAALDVGDSTVGATSYTSNAFVTTANKLTLFAVTNTKGTDPAETPTVTKSGATFTQICTTNFAILTVPYRITVFRAMGASASGTATMDFAGATQTGGQWSVAEFDGVDTSGVNGANAIVQCKSTSNTASAASSLTITMDGVPAGGNGTYGAFFNNVNSAVTVGTGFTGIHDQGGTSPLRRTFSEWKNSGDQTVDASNGNVATSWVGLAIEIKASSGACTGAMLLGLVGC